ncbi:unnamed protein product [Ambrosiozyma monospora]|uniref:Leucine carboxyl methyltransferase 1 n=1 Tax=Ambrosiozyma monospora TaxID=43982 RepID=A0A9W6YQZ3_AMBMO|nr:unnamed protein product [Ambrosiozyma monospora]
MNPHQSTTTETDTIRSTDQDALSSRLSTQLRNYPPSDPFLIPLISKVINLKKMLIETNNTDQSSFGLKLKQGRELKKIFFNLFDDSNSRNGTGTGPGSGTGYGVGSGSGNGAGFSAHIGAGSRGAGPIAGGLRGTMSGGNMRPFAGPGSGFGSGHSGIPSGTGIVTGSGQSLEGTPMEGLKPNYRSLLMKPNTLKSPVLNRGTWLRTVSINAVIDKFLQEHEDKGFEGDDIQIVNLGAGNDTRCFNLLKQQREKKKNNNSKVGLKIVEIDFEDSCKLKKFSILSSAQLSSAIGIDTTQTKEPIPTTYEEFQNSSSELTTPNYKLLSADLRDTTSLQQLFQTHSISQNSPTLILSECCICYMDKSSSNGLLKFLKTYFHKAGSFVIYDPVGGNPNANYGDVMRSNLAKRGIEMPCLMVYRDVEGVKRRLIDEVGFENGNVGVWDMKWIYHHWVDQDLIGQITRLEFLDELEELDLINLHYVLVVASWGDDVKLEPPFTISST